MQATPLLVALALAAAAAAPPPAPAPAAGAAPALDCGDFTCRHFDKPAKAFAAVMESKPLVLGLGEYHEIEGGPKVKSAIKRFTESMLPLLKGKASDLIAETWITNGNCGKAEVEAKEQIEKESERPATTEDEVVTMLKKGSSLDIAPHILTLECEDYEDLLDDKREIDNVKLLEMVTRLLREKAETLSEKQGKDGKAVVIYGGALHNDLSPSEELASFSFGPELKKSTGGRYVQLGLYVPELIERDEETKQAAWYPFFLKHVSTTKTLLITLAPDAHLLIFPRSAQAKPQAKLQAKPAPPAKR
ncbi:MAG TPA: hypothetical protein VGK67_27245 [Myxococcales bacterium]|jgi:hypothetical protein